MKVPFLDLKRQHDSIKDEISEALDRVREREWYILGPEVEAFEAEFAEYIGTKYAVGVANGTEALQIALLALGVDNSASVLTVANTAVPTAAAIRMARAKPLFTEIDQKDWNMDAIRIEQSVEQDTTVILPVHLYGNPAPIDDIIKVARKKNLNVIEDCCQAHGAEISGRKTGTFGDIAAFSFYPSKNLSALGDGGIIVTDNVDLYKKCRLIRNYGQENKNKHNVWGINSRLDDIQAAVLRAKLRHLEDWNGMRRDAAEMYKNLLKSTPLSFQKENGKSVYHVFAVRLPSAKIRDNFTQYLNENGIDTAVHYPMPIYDQKDYLKFKPKAKLPVTDKHCYSVVSLPIFPFIKKEEIEYTADKVKKYFEQTE
jgi:dTDP-4-amino-4,6-dideoxygalactose transaminase